MRKAAIYAVNQRISMFIELQELLCSGAIVGISGAKDLDPNIKNMFL